MKDLKFGWQGNNAFESCHRGISPFSVPHSSIEVRQRLRALEEDADQAARRCNPNVDYRMVMATVPQPKPRITVMHLNRAGCFDYLFFGHCTNSRCSFKHDGSVDEAKIEGAIEKMRPGLAKFVELN
jgi:hypothetical protein